MICVCIHRSVSWQQWNCLVVAASCCTSLRLCVFPAWIGKAWRLDLCWTLKRDCKLWQSAKSHHVQWLLTQWPSRMWLPKRKSHMYVQFVQYTIYHIIDRIFAFCPSLFISLLDLLCWIDCDLRQEAGNLKPATCGSLIHYRIKLPAWRQSCSDCWPAFCTATEEGCWAVGLTLCMSWGSWVQRVALNGLSIFKCSNSGQTLMKP